MGAGDPWTPAYGFSSAPTQTGADPYGLGPLGLTSVLVGHNSQTGPAFMGGPSNRFLGVPYSAPSDDSGRPMAPSTTKVMPTTASGNQIAATMAANASNDPATFLNEQLALYNAGFYGSEKPVLGVYTAKDTAALKKALGSWSEANASGQGGMELPAYLKAIATSLAAMGLSPGGGGGGSGRAPLTINYTDPAELHATLQSAAQNALGRNLSSDELDKFVNAFHQKEASAQRAAYGGHNSTNPEATGESYDYVQGHNQAEVQQRSQATYLDSIDQLLGVK